MRQKLQQFMYGRYGVDAFGRFTLFVTLVIWVLNFFIGSTLLYFGSLFLIFYSYYRMFSRNIQKRYQENQKYMTIKNKFVSKFKSQKSIMKQRKTHHIYKCPTCRQKIRIPRGKGRICITCPKCKNEFTKIS